MNAPAKHQPVTNRAQLPRPWQVWLASNLADRIPESTLIEVLVKSLGLDHMAAARQVAVYHDAPGVEAARSVADRLHKLESLLDVRHTLTRMARSPGDVPHLGHLDRDVFLQDHYSANVPAFAQGCAAAWPALQRWTPAALAERHGDEMVEVMAERQADPAYEINHNSHRQEVRLRDYETYAKPCYY